MLTGSQFKELFPNCADADGWVKAMNEVFPKYGIDTPARIAAFVAQCGHESGGWRVFEENLNYSAKSLDAVFPKYFKNAGRNAEEYARKPEKIANVVYAGRMGNNNDGDGYKYRGRGPIQLTGKDNYNAFGKDFGMDLSNPDVVSTNKNIALMSAIWFWNKNSLNKLADAGDIKGMTKRINGGFIGLEDRIHHYEQAMKKLGADAGKVESKVEEHEHEHVESESYGLLRKGMKGEGVKIMQAALGVQADGIFGSGTEAKLKEWQAKNGLSADGICGPATFAKLLND